MTTQVAKQLSKLEERLGLGFSAQQPRNEPKEELAVDEERKTRQTYFEAYGKQFWITLTERGVPETDRKEILRTRPRPEVPKDLSRGIASVAQENAEAAANAVADEYDRERLQEKFAAEAATEEVVSRDAPAETPEQPTVEPPVQETPQAPPPDRIDEVLRRLGEIQGGLQDKVDKDVFTEHVNANKSDFAEIRESLQSAERGFEDINEALRSHLKLIDTAHIKANEAFGKAEKAEGRAETAFATASSANTAANEAKDTSNFALETARTAEGLIKDHRLYVTRRVLEPFWLVPVGLAIGLLFAFVVYYGSIPISFGPLANFWYWPLIGGLITLAMASMIALSRLDRNQSETTNVEQTQRTSRFSFRKND